MPGFGEVSVELEGFRGVKTSEAWHCETVEKAAEV